MSDCTKTDPEPPRPGTQRTRPVYWCNKHGTALFDGHDECELKKIGEVNSMTP